MPAALQRGQKASDISCFSISYITRAPIRLLFSVLLCLRVDDRRQALHRIAVIEGVVDGIVVQLFLGRAILSPRPPDQQRIDDVSVTLDTVIG